MEIAKDPDPPRNYKADVNVDNCQRIITLKKRKEGQKVCVPQELEVKMKLLMPFQYHQAQMTRRIWQTRISVR